MVRRIVVAIGLMLALAACNTRTHQLTTTLNRTDGEQPKIILMPLDVELSLLSAGGLPEPRADWTETANKLLLEAIRTENQSRNVRLAIFDDNDAGVEKDLSNQLIKLHGAVGRSILLHQYTPENGLPTKADRFEWSLGPEARALKESHKADYALFVWMRDSYTSGGRAVMMFLAAAAFGVALPGGQQVGFASLVDLETGNVVWFNLLARGNGDLRNAEGAQNTAQALLSQLPQ
ncbi:hypothetical protein [Ferrovibrio sp.]|uniref:hypothetical protein n=1 Tax=Ferrovibrio sp. TaxID=1917215 RepID=UPI00311EA3A2